MSRTEQGAPPVRRAAKTEAGRRTIALGSFLVGELAALLSRRGLTAADADELVFPNTAGRPLHYSTWRRRTWTPAVEAAGLVGLGFHDLRRLATTAMVAGGVDVRTAQHRLGHSDARTTLEVYAQVVAEADRAAAEGLSDALAPRTRANRARDRRDG